MKPVATTGPRSAEEFGTFAPVEIRCPSAAVRVGGPREKSVFSFPTRDRGGRPVKLSLTAALAIVTALCREERLEDAARAGGIGPSTLYRWLAAGRKGDPRFGPLVEAVDAASRRGAERASDRAILALCRMLG